MVRIKICGITSVQDAALACDAGADALGVIGVTDSPRFVAPLRVAAIVRAAGPFVPVVSVVRLAAERHNAGETWTQFYEGAAPERHTGIRAFRILDQESLKALQSYAEPVVALLLDTYHASGLGGTGACFDWALAEQARALRPDLPLILAGGLTPENVGEAVRQVRPYAVDVSSGVEARPGTKDAARVRDFIAAVRGA